MPLRPSEATVGSDDVAGVAAAPDAPQSGGRGGHVRSEHMHAILSDFVLMSTQLQARGGFLRGIGRLILVVIVVLVLFGVFLGMRLGRRGR